MKSRTGVARLFLDANVFLYAIGADSPHRTACRAVLEAVGQGKLDGITSSEVLQEILHVRSRRMSVQDAASAVRAAADLVVEVLPVTRDDVLEACHMLEAHTGLGARDALHAAVMKNSEVHMLVSVDRDFDAVPELKRLEPAQALTLVRDGASPSTKRKP
jgi:predicted nucleic acid-binding protein